MKEIGSEPGCYLNLKHSGAALAWKFFFPDFPTPKLIQYVEDQDLWNWALPNSKEFNIARDLVPFDFQEWNKLLDDSVVEQMIVQVTVPSVFPTAFTGHIFNTF
eukprot:TRINITY_DN3035_c0_g2_i1.p3 TRINITY_DN3035_c0_g2~~TRINITY_DN3035_c0_g2_i1.p3  ORF type:complete len:104 (-),score=20.01 TRINITY_DN3035_c0_g2_i1:806-1117(-)